jgi:hypothetical protein
MALRLCLRCGKPIYRKGQKYHYECRELTDAEFRARIEAMPETVVTDEDVRRFFMPEIEESPLVAALRARGIEPADNRTEWPREISGPMENGQSIESADVGAPTDSERKELC